MKKKLLLLLLVIALLPTRVFAMSSFVEEYETKNLKETLEAEGMTLENTDYKETDDQAIIYMFRGNGCGFCRAFLEFLNSISKEYGKYFKLVSFEVWSNSKNAELMEKVPLVTNKAAGGVPYIIIGDKVFGGYTSSYDEDIKAAIKAQYDDSSYDVFDELDKRLNGNTDNGGSSFVTIFWNAFFVIAGTVAIIVVNNKNTQKVLDAVGKKETKENKKK